MLNPPGARLGPRVMGEANLVVMLSPPGAGSERCLAASLATRLGFALAGQPPAATEAMREGEAAGPATGLRCRFCLNLGWMT